MRPRRQSVVPRRMLSLIAVIGALTMRPSTAQAQCVWWLPNSCLNVSFTPGTTTPGAEDFANGVAVLGRFSVSVLKCGRTPCRVTIGAQGQPPGGLRVRVGGTAPASMSDCPIDLNGIVSPSSANAPVIAQVTAGTTVVVWVCRPVSWNPATTPLGTTSTDVRFLLRQN